MGARIVVAETTREKLVTLWTHHFGSTHVMFAPHDALLFVLQNHPNPENPPSTSRLPEKSIHFPHPLIQCSGIPSHDASSSRHDHTRNS